MKVSLVQVDCRLKQNPRLNLKLRKRKLLGRGRLRKKVKRPRRKQLGKEKRRKLALKGKLLKEGKLARGRVLRKLKLKMRMGLLLKKLCRRKERLGGGSQLRGGKG